MWPLGIYFALVLLLVIGMLLVSYLLGQRHSERATGSPYEGGILSEGSARVRLSAKFYLVADSIRMNRSDGALVRVNTPIAEGETTEHAQERLMSVVDSLNPLLDRYIPR